MLRHRNFFLAVMIIGLALPTLVGAQARRQQGATQKTTLPKAWVDQMKWRSIGPANMSGRITSLAFNPKDRNNWWAATASGGLLKTTNNGVTFEHQFDREATVSIGDVQIAASNPNILWVGTGEGNPRNSVSWGDGVYKSTDGGKTWKNMGLKKIYQTGRIAIHPTNPDIVYVGALGRLWGPSEDRGLYKTTNGGKSWKKIHYIDDKTGVIDVQMDPKNPETLIIATYERLRDGFDGNDPVKKYGAGSGLYKTTDGGKKWTKLTKGLPTVKMGRIGLSYYQKDPKFVYAIVETEKIGTRPPNFPYIGVRGEDADVGAKLTSVVSGGPAAKAGLKVGDIVVSVDGKVIHSYNELLECVQRHSAGKKLKFGISRDRKGQDVQVTLGKQPDAAPAGRGRGGRSAQGRGQGRGRGAQGRGGQGRGRGRGSAQGRGRGGRQRSTRNEFTGTLGGQSANLQDRQGKEGFEYGGVYRSKNGGNSWERINTLNQRPMYYSQIRVDPSDNNYVYVLGTSLYRSKDGGKTFTGDGARGEVHVDHHAMWIDPNDGRHIGLGNDGGIYVTYDRMENWDHHNHVAIGQFYHVGVGPRRNYRVYGGLQDNGSWGGPSRVANAGGPENSDWFRVLGGDGFICLVDPLDPDQIYAESQNGNMASVNLRTGRRSSIRPRGRYRFNWKTPFILSPHNSRIHYSAGNHVFRSVNKGTGIEAFSPEITNTDRGSGSAVTESGVEAGVIYAGTTDGALWMTRNHGKEWSNLFPLPKKDARPAADSDEKEADEAEGGKEDDKKNDGKEKKDEKEGVDKKDNDKKEGDKKEGDEKKDDDAKKMDDDNKGDEKKDDDKKDDDKKDSKDKSKKDKADDKKAEPKKDPVPAALAKTINGVWVARLTSGNFPRQMELRLEVRYANGKFSGTYRSPQNQGEITSGKIDVKSKELSIVAQTSRSELSFSGPLSGTQWKGKLDLNGNLEVDFEARRTGDASAGQTPAPSGKPLATLMPGPRWVSSLEASKHQRGRCYVTFDGHRSNDDAPYVFVSEDYGKTWRSIVSNLPKNVGSTRVIREDPVNANLLYLGCEFGCWVSIDRGTSWTRLNSNLPTVAVHEFAIHPTAGEIVAGTHGRSLWVLDVTILRQLTAEAMSSAAKLYRPNTIIQWRTQPTRGSSGTRRFRGENPARGAQIAYSLNRAGQTVAITIHDATGREVRKLDATNAAGLNVVTWDLRQSNRRTSSTGTYTVKLVVGGEEQIVPLRIEADPDAPRGALTASELELQEALLGTENQEEEGDDKEDFDR